MIVRAGGRWLAVLLILGVSLAPGAGEASGRVLVGLAGGRFWPQGRELHLLVPGQGTDLRLAGVRYTDRSFEFPLYYRISVLRSLLGGAFQVGVSFTHAKVYANPDAVVTARGKWHARRVSGPKRLGDIIESFSVSHGLNLFTLEVQPCLLRGGALELSAVAGAGLAWPHTEATLAGVHQEQYEWDGPVLEAGVDLRWWLDGRAALQATFLASHCWLRKLNVPGGTVSTQISGLHLALGLAVQISGGSKP